MSTLTAPVLTAAEWTALPARHRATGRPVILPRGPVVAVDPHTRRGLTRYEGGAHRATLAESMLLRAGIEPHTDPEALAAVRRGLGVA